MPRYKVTIAYDGTNFSGFQRQLNARSVQEELEKTLTKINHGQFVPIFGAGRTDAHVHAKNQVIHFDLKSLKNLKKSFDSEKLRFALDTQSPEDIAVKLVELVPATFHARFSPHQKIYEFHVQITKPRNPFLRNFSTYFPYPLDLTKIRAGLQLLVGTHDFTGFCASGSSVKNKVRTISHASLKEANGELIFTFRGTGFLYKQIRIMVGTLLKIGTGSFPIERIMRILTEKKRSLTGPTAHPEGLFLLDVIYE